MSEGPFRRLRGILLVAAACGLAATVGIVAGGRLPGGRWKAVHLFTLGALTNLVLRLSNRFARTLTGGGGAAPW